MKWISVEDRLPEPTQEVILFAPGCRTPVFTGFISFVWERSCSGVRVNGDYLEDDPDFEPTHWMPLPDPPKSLQNP